MKPAWFKLIEEWRKGERFGLTIPFLVGALRDWPGRPLGLTAGVEELRILLESIRDETPQGVTMRLYDCDKLQELALAPVDGIPQACFHITSPHRAVPAFYVENGTVPDGGTSLDDVVAALWQRYGADIEAGNFSRRARVFQPFDANDRALISAAITRLDDDWI